MIIRFVQGKTDSLVSFDIEARENVSMPLRPSHVEMVSRDGAHYVGAHIEDGVQARPFGYDAGKFTSELLLDLGPEGDEAAFAYMESKIGAPYDWKSIVDFLLPINWHQYNHLICSAFGLLTLRKKMFFPNPVAWPAHMTSPRDLLGLVSAVVKVPGI